MPKASSSSTRCGCAPWGSGGDDRKKTDGPARRGRCRQASEGDAMRGRIAGSLAAMAVLLAACSSDKGGVAVDPNVPPPDYEREILNVLRSNLEYPTNVREA